MKSLFILVHTFFQESVEAQTMSVNEMEMFYVFWKNFENFLFFYENLCPQKCVVSEKSKVPLTRPSSAL